jgi:phytoene synthase
MTHPADNALVAQSRQVLSHHARSFRWAGTLLTREQLDRAALVYAFCRLVDDIADETPSVVQAREDLTRLREEWVGATPPSPLVSATRSLLEHGGAGAAPALHLIDGALSDLDPVLIADDRQLLRYSYRVAGTVGLMMCAVLQVQAPQSAPFAVDLGIAMQITNICRDVREDAARGRVYLPATRLRKAGIEPVRMIEAATGGPALSHEEDIAIREVVRDLLDVADRYYDSAQRGMHYIPTQARLAIHVAQRIYQGIGVRLRYRGCAAWSGRTSVGWMGKIGWTLVGLLDFARATRFPPQSHTEQLHLELRDLPGCGT